MKIKEVVKEIKEECSCRWHAMCLACLEEIKALRIKKGIKSI